jgi:hypothetical protein
MKTFHVLILALLVAAAAPAARSHHSGSEYDYNHIVEIEGTLVELKWQNPHVLMRVRTRKAAQRPEMTWDIEGSSVSVLRRSNVDPRWLHIGDKVRVAGEQSKRAPNRMFAHNVLASDGKELVFHPGGKPRWARTAMGTSGNWFEPGVPGGASASLFRVWSWKADDPQQIWLPEYPLTAAAKQKVAKWDPVHDEVMHGCEPKGMPTIMETPYPVEFVREGDIIRLRMEEYDTVRTIHMNPQVNREPPPKHSLGRSIGRWDGNTLVVNTDGILWRYLDTSGVPLSAAATLVERFTPSSDGALLRYSLVVTDPENFTRPVELERSWVARPGESVKRFECGKS